MAEANTPEEQVKLNRQLAQMLKGGVIMDVTTPEQARIAEEAGACAVMALERIPADIRAAGGVSQQRAGPGIAAHQVQGAAHHVPPAGGDDGVGLGVHAAAQLVPSPA